MSETAQLVIVAIAALIVGVTIPVLVALRATLKRAETALETLERETARLGTRVDPALVQATAVLEAARAALEGAQPLIEASGRLATSMDELRAAAGKAAAVGAAIGPAIVAAVRAIQRARLRDEDELDDEGEDKAEGDVAEGAGKATAPPRAPSPHPASGSKIGPPPAPRA